MAVNSNNNAGTPQVNPRSRKKQSPTVANPANPEPQVGATQSIAEGKLEAQPKTQDTNAIDTLIPVGTEADQLRLAILNRGSAAAGNASPDNTLNLLKKEFDIAAEKDQVVGTLSSTGDHTFDVAAALVGARFPGLEEKTVAPETLLTPKVADPIDVADVELHARPQPVFADIIDSAAVTIQIK